jgi:GNAT superfamily N-acetyltransferase
MPSFTMIPPRGNHTVHGHFWIPIDDENCWAWSYDFHPTRAITDAEREAMMKGKGIHVLNVPGTYRPVANKDNDYLIDRAAQRRGDTYSGVEGIAMQDASIQESMGPIVDRSKENLVGTDKGIVMARRRLMRAAKALMEQGTAPPGVDPAHQGKGLGGVLMRHATDICDRDGVLAYLESSNLRNVPLYERHGFEILGTIQAGSSPVITPMLRKPRRR